MPRQKKPPRLWLRGDGGRRRRWVILDGDVHKRTGCSEDQIADAEAALARYIAEKRKPRTNARRATQANLGDILTLYLDLKEATIARPRDLRAQIGRLNEFWGGMTADAIKGEMCRRYVAERGAKIGARRELEIMRAAVHHYAKEYGLDVTPNFTLEVRINAKPTSDSPLCASRPSCLRIYDAGSVLTWECAPSSDTRDFLLLVLKKLSEAVENERGLDLR